MDAIKTLIIDPFHEFLMHVAGYIPTFISVVFILMIGVLLAKLVRDVFQRLFQEVHIDVIADKSGLTSVLQKGGVKSKLGDLLSAMLYLIITIVILMMSIALTGVNSLVSLMDQLVGYVPNVLSAIFVLTLGLILAKIIGSSIYVVASHLQLPNSKLLDSITRWAIVLYAIKMTVVQLGYDELLQGISFYIIFTGVILGLTLAFGLGGRDAAMKYLNHKK